MQLSYWKYELTLKHRFEISYHTRKSTPIVIVRLRQDKYEGFGEASLPPYLSETQDSVIAFLRKLKLYDINSFDELLKLDLEVANMSSADNAAKSAVNIALHDLLGKILEKPCYSFYNIKPEKLPFTSFTIGIDTPEVLVDKIKEANPYKILKVKLGTENDRTIIETIRSKTDKPLYVDVNQGWSDKNFALEFIHYLKEQNVLLIEQPFAVLNRDDSAWLSERSPLPIIADESLQTIEDIETVKGCFTGINIKLMKCGGISSAYKMIMKGRENNLKIMLGCMTESSCGISAALHLASLADYADLDGNQLIENDPFICKSVNEGRLILPEGNGLGIKPGKNFL